MPDTPAYLAGRLSKEGQKTQEFFKDLTPEQWALTVYSDGSQWTIRQILSHFVASEVSFTRLIENVLRGGSGAPEDFDTDAYNERKVRQLQEISSTDLIAQYGQVRERNVELVSGMSADDLLREGRHPFLKVAPVKDMVKLIYRHNQIHQRDIRRLLK